MSDADLGYSEEVLCQRDNGQIFTGYVRHDMDGEFDHCWIQSGRDMYNLDGIVRWIPLSEVVGQIATHDDHGDIACPWCGGETTDLLDLFPGKAWHDGSSIDIKCGHCGKAVTLTMSDKMKMSEPVRFTCERRLGERGDGLAEST